MDGIVILYMVIGVCAVVLGYTIMRAVDFCFTKAEDQRRHKMKKAEIRCYNRGQQQMAINLTKKLNDNLLSTFQKMGDL